MKPRDESYLRLLFHGLIAEQLVHPYPRLPSEQRDNLRLMLKNVRQYCAQHLDSAYIDEHQMVPEPVLAGLKALGLFGLSVSADYGGIGLSATAVARMMEEVAAHDATLSMMLSAHQCLGLRAIENFGTEEQKRRYLPRLAAGDALAAFALTEPAAGSDASALQTCAEADPDGGGYRIRGTKSWVTNGGLAEVFVVFARTQPAHQGTRPRITAFIVERGPRVKSGPPAAKMGVRGVSTTEVVLDNVLVPASAVLGEVGRGYRVAMEVLMAGRLMLAASCLGQCKMLIRMATDRAERRRVFGKQIRDFELVKDKIARMVSETWALESMTYLTTGLVDACVVDYALESAACKVFGSEALWRIANETMQVAGAAGYWTSLPYERHLRDSRVNLVFEGTNEILRAFIALGGMHGPGRAIERVAQALREPLKGLGLLSDLAIRRARTALNRERFTAAHPLLSREVALIEQYAAELGRMVDRALRKYEKAVAERELMQRRVAEVAVDLYALTACVSRTTSDIQRLGEQGAARQLALTSAFASLAEERLRQRVASFDKNNDEPLMALAEQAYADRGYPFDIV